MFMSNTVLVVDDLAIIRDPIAGALRAAGFNAVCASDGAKALEILRTQQVDLVLLDVKMPVMDGISLLRILRRGAFPSVVPVMMLSGEEDREDVLQAAKLGIRGYVLKSNFSLKDLRVRISRHFTCSTQNNTAAIANMLPSRSLVMIGRSKLQSICCRYSTSRRQPPASLLPAARFSIGRALSN
jgi:two-component system chemotaxis response regulator CheY